MSDALSRWLRIYARRALFYPLPARFRLPFDVWLSRVRGREEPELRYLDRVCPHQGSAVDVGAHRGHYSYRLSKLFRNVLSFEINADLLEDLKAYNPGNIRIVPAGLSSSSRAASLFIPIVDGRQLTGWGSLQPDNLPSARSHVAKYSQVVTLDAFDLADVSFIKIDVEGHELEVLAGAVNTIERCRPLLLVEVKAPNSVAVERLLATHGYDSRRLYDLIGIQGSPENVFFLPGLKRRTFNESAPPSLASRDLP